MNKTREIGETCVAAGIRAYIGLLGYGEERRSRQLFRDTLELSAALAGGPSSKIDGLMWRSATDQPGVLQQSLIRAAVTSMLASLFVLRTTIYWQKVPILEALLESCSALAQDTKTMAERRTSGTKCPWCGHRSCDCDDPGLSCGCRRNDTLPTGPGGYVCRPTPEETSRQLELIR